MSQQSLYLIALSLIEQHGKRQMPLGGRSCQEEIASETDASLYGQSILLELLIRLIQRTDEAALKRAARDKSLLLIHMPMESMQSFLPILKTNWIETGDTDKFLAELHLHCRSIWQVTFVKYEGFILKEI